MKDYETMMNVLDRAAEELSKDRKVREAIRQAKRSHQALRYLCNTSSGSKAEVLRTARAVLAMAELRDLGFHFRAEVEA